MEPTEADSDDPTDFTHLLNLLSAVEVTFAHLVTESKLGRYVSETISLSAFHILYVSTTMLFDDMNSW